MTFTKALQSNSTNEQRSVTLQEHGARVALLTGALGSITAGILCTVNAWTAASVGAGALWVFIGLWLPLLIVVICTLIACLFDAATVQDLLGDVAEEDN